MGCVSSAAAREAATPAKLASAFVHSIHCQPYGVLGLGQGSGWSQVRQAPDPDATTVILDPAGITYIRDPNMWASDAGGASGAIYKFVGLDRDFPPDVVAGIQHVGDSTYHRYGYPDGNHVIHVAGPDFRADARERAEALEELTHCYYGVLRLAAQVGRPLFRMLPISAGIFAGRFMPEMPILTAEALYSAAERMATDCPELLRQLLPTSQAEKCPVEPIKVHLCIYQGGSAMHEYSSALRHVADRQAVSQTGTILDRTGPGRGPPLVLVDVAIATSA